MVRPNFRLLCATTEDRPGELTAVFDDRKPLRKSLAMNDRLRRDPADPSLSRNG